MQPHGWSVVPSKGINRIVLGLYWGYIGFILGLYWVILGVYWDYGKENGNYCSILGLHWVYTGIMVSGNYYLGFKVYTGANFAKVCHKQTRQPIYKTQITRISMQAVAKGL